MVGMSAFIPTTFAYLKSVTGEFTAGGEQLWSKPVRVGVSIVRWENRVSQTSVRADRSGTKSYADEEVPKGRVLIHPRHIPKEGDILIFSNQEFVIESVREVYAMDGKLDHYQVDL